MIYRFKLGVLLYNHGVDTSLDTILKRCIKSGILRFEANKFDAVVEFKNGITFKYWNNNKYYSWMSKGSMTRDGFNYTYSNCRPKSKTMYLFLNEINNYYVNKLV